LLNNKQAYINEKNSSHKKITSCTKIPLIEFNEVKNMLVDLCTKQNVNGKTKHKKLCKSLEEDGQEILLILVLYCTK
jgi:hypothetical protein